MKKSKLYTSVAMVLAVSFIITLILSVTAYAAVTVEPLKASLDSSTKMISVTGVLSTGSGKSVTIRIIDPNGNIEYINQSTTSTSGQFEFKYLLTNTATGVYTVEIGTVGLSTPQKTTFSNGISKGLVGDLNGDNKINSTDYALMRRYILGIVEGFPVDDDMWAADLNGDGKINSTDYALMRRYILGIIEKFTKT